MEQKDIDRIIEMRLKDRTLFEAIKIQFGLSESAETLKSYFAFVKTINY